MTTAPPSDFQPRRSLGMQAILLAASTAVAQALVAVVYVFAARTSAAHDFGIAVTAIAIGNIAFGVLDFGGNQFWVRELVRGKMEATVLGSHVVSKLLLGATLAAVAVPALSPWVSGSLLWEAPLTALTVFVAQCSQIPMRALGRGELVSLATVVDRLVAVAAFFALSSSVPGPEALVIALAIGAVADAFTSTLLTPREHRLVIAFGRQNPFAGATHYGVASLGLSAQSLDLPLMSAVASPAAAGIYGAVNRWTQPMGLLANAFARASSPYAARAHSIDEAIAATRRGLWLPALAGVGCVLVAVFGPPLVPLVIGEQYASSGVVLRLLAIGTLPAVANQIVAVGLQSLGRDRLVSRILVSGVAMQLVLVVALAPSMGAVGAAIAFVALQVVTIVVFAWVLLRMRRGRA